METAYIVDNKAIPILSEEDINLVHNLSSNFNSRYETRERCIFVIQSLEPMLKKLDIMASSFKSAKSFSYDLDVLKTNSLVKKINSIHPKSKEDVERYNEFFNESNWITSLYSLASNRLFNLNRLDSYKDYVVEDLKYLISIILKDTEVDSLLDLRLNKCKFRRFLYTPKTHIDVVFNFTYKDFISILKTLSSCSDYSILSPDYLGSAVYCLAYWGRLDIYSSEYSVVYDLFSRTYYNLIKDKYIISSIKNII